MTAGEFCTREDRKDFQWATGRRYDLRRKRKRGGVCPPRSPTMVPRSAGVPPAPVAAGRGMKSLRAVKEPAGMKTALVVLVAVAWAGPAPGAEPLPWLSVDTSRRAIVNEAGQEVRLTGSNLGNWLVQEIWMFPLAERTAPQ